MHINDLMHILGYRLTEGTQFHGWDCLKDCLITNFSQRVDVVFHPETGEIVNLQVYVGPGDTESYAMVWVADDRRTAYDQEAARRCHAGDMFPERHHSFDEVMAEIHVRAAQPISTDWRHGFIA